jgi:dTMP kinase
MSIDNKRNEVIQYIKNNVTMISFEGMDCSYKETNSNKLANIIGIIGYEVELVSFPRYKNPSAYFVEQYLSGNIKVDGNTTMDRAICSGTTVCLFYVMDMIKWYNEYIDKLMKEENLEDKKRIVIFDRYAYSNMYYPIPDMFKTITKFNLSKEEEKERILNLQCKIVNKVIDTANIPRVDLIIKMVSDRNLLYEKVKEKNKDKKGDLYESNINYLMDCFEIFKKLKFTNMTSSKLTEIDMFEIEVSGKDEEEVFEEVLKGVKEIV